MNEGVGPDILADGTTNSVPGAPTTTGYAIDLNTASLVKFDAAHPSTLRTVGKLDFRFNLTGSMDIQPGTNLAFVVGSKELITIVPAGYEQKPFLVDFETGHAGIIGDIAPTSEHILIAMAVAPNGVLRLAAPTSIDEGETGTLRIERLGGSIGSIDATITIGASGANGTARRTWTSRPRAAAEQPSPQR